MTNMHVSLRHSSGSCLHLHPSELLVTCSNGQVIPSVVKSKKDFRHSKRQADRSRPLVLVAVTKYGHESDKALLAMVRLAVTSSSSDCPCQGLIALGLFC